ncbi:hypothetical protein V8G54_034281 [Vigna mungo]|uniref:CCHC-type domain-containing protein n=1 Tax=Vigna mungo TaxID=3915 RepID=A0AAQ3RH52_VIGMU
MSLKMHISLSLQPPAQSIVRLITSRRPPEKEFVQSYRFTHLHYGAIKLILSLHGRRGLPVSARVSLLDSSFLHYENAVIGTILTTLHAGSVVLTMFPNYNVSLRDPTVPQRLKVQVQITGAGQVAEALCATLHHQIIYRLQNHAVNLSLPSSTEGDLFVMANPHEESPSIVQIPRNISRQQLEELIPLQCVTNYEKLHENKKPLQTSEATFRRSVDGTIRTIFKQLGDEASTSSSQIFQSMMIRPITKEKKIPIWGVLPNGKPIFTDNINSHFIWDVDPSMCDLDCECSKDDDNSEDEKPDENTDHEDYCRPFPPPKRRSDPSSGPWIDIHKPKEPDPLWFQRRCFSAAYPFFMISGSNYEQEFPSLERTVDPTTRISTKLNISPSEIGPDGRSKPLTQAEELQPELNRMAMTAQKDFSTMTMGQIHEMTKETVDKLCRQRQYFSDLMNNKGKFGKACKKSYLEIKCKDKCSCQSKKNKGEKPYKRKEKNLKFFKKRNFRKRPQGQRCYLCGKKGHFAKYCPNKADKAIKLVTSLKIRDEEVESLYSEQSSPDEDTVFTLRNSSKEEYSEEDTLPIFSTEEINSLNPSPPHPNVEVQILPTKFNKPVKAIAYIDIGAQKTMMNPDIL